VVAFLDQALSWAMRVVPVAALISIAAYVAAQQAVSPNRRMVKLAVMLALSSLMFRFDMVWSVYAFTLLFPFPSGIAVGSTNTVLMTLIPMIWAVRATSQKQTLFYRGPLDAAIGVFLLAYVVSLYSVSEGAALGHSIRIIWIQVTAIAYYYMITRFVEDEEKLVRLASIVAIVCALVMATAVLELIAPGAVIIPGWIGLKSTLGEGTLKYRVEGIRVGGAFQSHGMLADFGTQIFMFMVFFIIRARNPVARVMWAIMTVVTLVAILATANRGAGAGFAVAVVLGLVLFRSRMPFHVQVIVVLSSVSLFLGAQMVLERYTVAASLMDRFTATEFEGVVPDTRKDTWVPALRGALERPFIGHGPWYDPGRGLVRKLWPHNGYLFYFYTIGVFGLSAFLWIIYRVFRCVMIWRHPALKGTDVGDMLRLALIWLVTMAVEQMRTDHQRDDIYPYIVWLCFGFGVAAWNVARRRIEREEKASTDATS